MQVQIDKVKNLMRKSKQIKDELKVDIMAAE